MIFNTTRRHNGQHQGSCWHQEWIHRTCANTLIISKIPKVNEIKTNKIHLNYHYGAIGQNAASLHRHLERKRVWGNFNSSHNFVVRDHLEFPAQQDLEWKTRHDIFGAWSGCICLFFWAIKGKRRINKYWESDVVFLISLPMAQARMVAARMTNFILVNNLVLVCAWSVQSPSFITRLLVIS